MIVIPALIGCVFLLGAACGESEAELDEFEDAERHEAAWDQNVWELSGIGVDVPSSLGLNIHNIVYLTFDDGPSTAHTVDILDILDAHNAPATFFLTGNRIASRAHIAREEISRGFLIGNHQFDHIVSSQASFRSQAKREHDVIDGLVSHRQPHFFRYPYGAGSQAKNTALQRLGYRDGGIGWHIDSLDWCFNRGGGYCARAEPAYRNDFVGWILAQTEQKGGGVLLLHDIQGITASHLDEILTNLEEGGYTFGALPTAGR